MSLRAKLIWGFVLVALGALLLSFAASNLGLYSTMMRMHHGSMMSHQPVGPQEFMAAALRWSLWSSLAAFSFAGLVGAVTAERITRSLRSLRDAAARLDLRDLSRRVPVEGRDEIAELAATFNRMCERLEAGERSRRQLLADTAHELRHPLAVMQGHLDLIQDGKVVLTQESLLPIQDEVIRLTRLVADLRDLSLAEVGKLSLHLTAVDVEALLQGLLANLGPVAAAKEVALIGEVAPEIPILQADPDRLRQVFVNLLSNALHYTPPGGRIELRAWLEGGELRASVADSGPGISPEDLPHIFERFYRADKSRSRETGGSGLGLAIVRSLVELHGGRITVESAPGQGSRFTVHLPVPS
jgi:two-component system sensor histidine kinase BaeS